MVGRQISGLLACLVIDPGRVRLLGRHRSDRLLGEADGEQKPRNQPAWNRPRSPLRRRSLFRQASNDGPEAILVDTELVTKDVVKERSPNLVVEGMRDLRPSDGAVSLFLRVAPVIADPSPAACQVGLFGPTVSLHEGLEVPERRQPRPTQPERQFAVRRPRAARRGSLPTQPRARPGVERSMGGVPSCSGRCVPGCPL